MIDAMITLFEFHFDLLSVDKKKNLKSTLWGGGGGEISDNNI